MQSPITQPPNIDLLAYGTLPDGAICHVKAGLSPRDAATGASRPCLTVAVLDAAAAAAVVVSAFMSLAQRRRKAHPAALPAKPSDAFGPSHDALSARGVSSEPSDARERACSFCR